MSGPLNGTDFKYIREMGGVGDADDGFHANTGGKLVYLDLSGASIVEGGSEYMYYKGEYASNPGGDYYYTSNNTVSVYMFGRTYIESIILPNSVKTLGNSAFIEASKLKNLTIPSGVQSIGNNCFDYCENLEKIYCYAINPPALDESSLCYIKPSDGILLYVPKGCAATYESSEWGSHFANILEMD